MFIIFVCVPATWALLSSVELIYAFLERGDICVSSGSVTVSFGLPVYGAVGKASLLPYLAVNTHTLSLSLFISLPPSLFSDAVIKPKWERVHPSTRPLRV